MKLARAQLNEPVELVCRQVAASLLNTATRNAERLGNPDDSESLHDFRVSVRRLTTCLEAYRQHFPKRIANKLRKRLRRVVSKTNPGRDDEVHMRLLKSQLRRKMPNLQRDGLALVLQEIEAANADAEEAHLEKVTSGFAKIREKLNAHFTEPQQAVQLDEAGRSLSFAIATGTILEKEASILRSELDRIEAVHEAKEAHRARLAAKHLRYILEPISPAVTGGKPAVRGLKSLQDILGDLRDLQTLEMSLRSRMERAATDWCDQLFHAAANEPRLSAITRSKPETETCYALAAAVQRVRGAQQRLFTNLKSRWLSANGDQFFARVEGIVRQLSGETDGAAEQVTTAKPGAAVTPEATEVAPAAAEPAEQQASADPPKATELRPIITPPPQAPATMPGRAGAKDPVRH